MYSSGITAQELIETIKSETDISIPVPDKSYIHSINAIEQFIYSELLNEFVKVDIKYSEIENDIIPLDSLEKPNNTLSPILMMLSEYLQTVTKLKGLALMLHMTLPKRTFSITNMTIT